MNVNPKQNAQQSAKHNRQKVRLIEGIDIEGIVIASALSSIRISFDS
jgi:hypothetical protein